MKEKDFDNNLESLIIDGLIKEAEQDNADFQNAMKHISDKEFDEIVMEPTYEDYSVCADAASTSVPHAEPSIDTRRGAVENPAPIIKRWQVFRPWITAAVSAAAVVLIVLLPGIHAMNGKLCDSALYSSSSFTAASRSAQEIDAMTNEQLKEELPRLEKSYSDCIIVDGKFTTYTEGFKEAGWDLTIAYLRLHKKAKAVEVLRTMEHQFSRVA